MSNPDGAAMSDDLEDFAREIADSVRSFTIAVREVAKAEAPDHTVSLLLLEVSQLMLAGGRLGAIVDVVPHERFEPDAGPDPDVQGLREALAELLGPIDEYSEVFDPYDPEVEVDASRLSDDIADITAELGHGLAHFDDGRWLEALWWWQFSYLNSWGAEAGSALRALHSVVAHVRLDAAADDAPDARVLDA
jgi:hypothetical protein